MAKTIEIQILEKMKKADRGVLFFSESFMTFGNDDAVRMALHRLVKSGEIERVAVGMFVRPKMDSVIGKVATSIQDIAKAIARRDRARIVPTGVYALNRLGLSTQVPLKVVYLTDGSARTIKVGNTSITFKKTAPKNVAAVGEISQLVIQALRTIGQKNIEEHEIKRIQLLLLKEKKSKLEHDIRLAPAWIREIMKSALTQASNE